MSFKTLQSKVTVRTFIKQKLLGLEGVDAYVGRVSAKRRVDVLKRFVDSGGVGCELGVFKGHFSQVLLNQLKPKKLHLIDPWWKLSEKWEWANGNQDTFSAYLKVLVEFEDALKSGSVVIHCDFDEVALNAMDSSYFDWAYIDSSHEFEHTFKELEILLPKMKQNGLICGDDWFVDTKHKHHGVAKAVQSFVASGELELLYTSDSDHQWIARVRLR